MDMIFPELQKKRFAKIDLNIEARRLMEENDCEQANPLLDSFVCKRFIEDCHRRFGVDFSYGGWMEDRSTLWRGSYLDDDKRYIHLGIDFNVPAGTAVAAVRSGTVIRIDNDYPEPYGWGNRVIVDDESTGCVLVFAHLRFPEKLRVGDLLHSGEVFANVGNSSENGGWFPHLHVQIIKREYFQYLLENDLRDLDGYGKNEDIELLRENYPDPMSYVGFLEGNQ